MRKTKIVCTLGPASEKEEVIRKMLLAGMNVARVNFSHGNYPSHSRTIDTFRKVRDELGVPASVMLDTKGPEIRTGLFENNYALIEQDSEYTLTTKEVMGNGKMCQVSYEGLPRELKAGDWVLIDDGKIKLQVKSTTSTDIVCHVVHGGEVSNRKGVNVPNVVLNMEYLSEKDQADLLFGISKNVDYVAASFVRRPEDVIMLRQFLNDNGGKYIKIISKIENVEGVEKFEKILELSDGIMVARGDMGVEVDFERLPGIQKRIIKRCQQSGKIVITATQMLESMIKSPLPTRAEISDVANAVYDGTSAVMLSGESAMGKYPVEAVKAMAKIAVQAENDDTRFVNKQEQWREMDFEDTTNAVGHATCTLAKDIHAKAIVAITKSGATAAKMSKFRPGTDIVAITPIAKVYHQLAMEWGITPILIENHNTLDELMENAIAEVKKIEGIELGDKLVVSAGLPLNIVGNTNMIRVETIK